MKQKLFFMLFAGITISAFSQVGIGTNTPQTTLDINGSMASTEGVVNYSSSSTTTIPLNYSFVKITGSAASNFNFVFSTTPHYPQGVKNGQRIVIYNDTAFNATYGAFIVQSKTAQEFIYSAGAWYSVKSPSTTPATLKWFYAPSLVLDTSVSATAKTVNVYENYKKQFTGISTIETNPNYGPSGTTASLPVYLVNELDYIITGYDKSVFSNVSINASGILTYTVSNPASDATFMNIVLVPKN